MLQWLVCMFHLNYRKINFIYNMNYLYDYVSFFCIIGHPFEMILIDGGCLVDINIMFLLE